MFSFYSVLALFWGWALSHGHASWTWVGEGLYYMWSRRLCLWRYHCWCWHGLYLYLLFVGEIKTTCSHRLNNGCFCNYSSGYRTGPVHFSVQYPTQLPGEHTAPAAIPVLVIIQTHEQSLFNQVPIHSWVKRVHMQVKCLAQNTAPHHGKRDPYPRLLSPKSQAIVTAPWCPACIWSIYFRCRDTEGGHYQGAFCPQWFFYLPLNVSETAPWSIYGLMQVTGHTQSPVLKGKKWKWFSLRLSTTSSDFTFTSGRFLDEKMCYFKPEESTGFAKPSCRWCHYGSHLTSFWTHSPIQALTATQQGNTVPEPTN